MGPRAFGTAAEILAHTGIRSPDRPARSESLYRLSYPGPPRGCVPALFQFFHKREADKGVAPIID